MRGLLRGWGNTDLLTVCLSCFMFQHEAGSTDPGFVDKTWSHSQRRRVLVISCLCTFYMFPWRLVRHFFPKKRTNQMLVFMKDIKNTLRLKRERKASQRLLTNSANPLILLRSTGSCQGECRAGKPVSHSGQPVELQRLVMHRGPEKGFPIS